MLQNTISFTFVVFNLGQDIVKISMSMNLFKIQCLPNKKLIKIYFTCWNICMDGTMLDIFNYDECANH